MRRWIVVGSCLAVGVVAGSLLMNSPTGSIDGDESSNDSARETSTVAETATAAATGPASKLSSVVATGANVGSGAAGFRVYADVNGEPGGAPPIGGDALAASGDALAAGGDAQLVGSQPPAELEVFQSSIPGGGSFVDARSFRQVIYAVPNERGEIVSKCVPANHVAGCGHITAAATTANEKKD